MRDAAAGSTTGRPDCPSGIGGGGDHRRLTFRDYGLGWDDLTHSQYGDLLLELYGSGFADTRALHFVNLYKYGGGFDMAAALAAKVSAVRPVRDPPAHRRRCRHHRAGRHLAARPPPRRAARRLERAGAAGRLPALLRPHVHEREGRALRRRHGRAAARLWCAQSRSIHGQRRSVALVGVALGAAFGSRILAVLAAPPAAAALVLISSRRRGRHAGARPPRGSANSSGG